MKRPPAVSPRACWSSHETFQEQTLKLEIWKEEQKDETVRLAMFKDAEGIGVCVVDAMGRPAPNGYILRISSNGIMRCFGLRNFGFQVDDEGLIKIIA